MANTKLISLLLICASFCGSAVWADDSSTLISEPPSTTNNNGTASSTSINAGHSQPDAKADAAMHTTVPVAANNINTRKAALPQKVFSLAAAIVIGTPVCIVRRTKYEEWYGVNGMVGESAGKGKRVLAEIFWFPLAAICGTCEAPFDAAANGLMYPAFSKDQLSQGKLTQNN